MNTNLITSLSHLVMSVAGAVIGTVLLITNHVDSATGVTLIVASLGLGTSAATAVNAITQANNTVPLGAVMHPSGPMGTIVP